MNAPHRSNSHVFVTQSQLWNTHFYDALCPTYKTYSTSGDVDVLLSACQELGPCVLLLDSERAWNYAEQHPGGFGTAYGAGASVLIVDDCLTTPSRIAEFLCCGCRGVLSSQASPTTIKKAVAKVCEGEIWAPRRVISSLLQKCLLQLGPNALTRRERDILVLIARGLTNKEIAERLFIARETVRWHIRSLYSKIGASNRVAAAAHAKEVLLLSKQTSTSDADGKPKNRSAISAEPPQQAQFTASISAGPP